MAQIFSPITNAWAKAGLAVALLLVVTGSTGYYVYWTSRYVSRVGVPQKQPVPFSHEHHVKKIGIDCRYCHTSVEESAFAGIPPTQTCMNCHSQLWTNAQMLEPVRESLRSGKPVEWNRVHDLPDYVYFNHAIHIKKGVACISCHGQVDSMPLMWKDKTLFMSWCLQCHRNPEPYIGRPEDVTRMTAPLPAADPGEAPKLREEHMKLAQLLRTDNYEMNKLTSCSTCHR